jgi:hypothetical protein
VAILVVKVNIRPVLKAIRQGMAERAVSLTKQTPRLVHMHYKVVSATLPQNFLSFVACKVFRGAIPISDPAFPIGEVHTVRKRIHHVFEQTARLN